MGKSSALAAFSMAELRAYKEGSQIPIKYKYQIAIPAVEKASTVTYYDGRVVVKIVAQLLIMKLNLLPERCNGPIQLAKLQWISKFKELQFTKIKFF